MADEVSETSKGAGFDIVRVIINLAGLGLLVATVVLVVATAIHEA